MPLAGRRGNVRDFVPLPQLTEEQSREVVEAASSSLFAEGRIYFFRYVTESLNRDADDAALRLSEAEAGSRNRRRCLALAGSHNGRSLHDYCERRTRVLQGVEALEPRLRQCCNDPERVLGRVVPAGSVERRARVRYGLLSADGVASVRGGNRCPSASGPSGIPSATRLRRWRFGLPRVETFESTRADIARFGGQVAVRVRHERA